MADEVENKPKFILNKQKNDKLSQSSESKDIPQEKKKVVVRRKPVVVTKSNDDKDKKNLSENTEGQKTSQSSNANTSSNVEKKEKDAAQKTTTTFELSPPRPNIKQGNLADKPKGNRQNNNGTRRDGSNRDGQNRDSGRFDRQRKDGGFTGAQAREGYQNRNDRNNGNHQGKGQFNRNGKGENFQGKGQFNKNAGQNKSGQAGANSRPLGASGQNRQGFSGNRSGFVAAPAPMEENKKASSKKTFVKKKTVYSRKDKEIELDDKIFNQKKKQVVKANPIPEKIEIMETISVSDLAKKMNLKASEIIGKLMSMGMMVSITQSIDADTATLLASEYGCDVHIINLYDETVIASEADNEEDMKSRPPVVTVMGHVDHGKTKTLDAIRSAKVAESEFGGITQHIGAYMVNTPKGQITFLDTPGHEAFTMMRARGAAITDIVILVVAADDGVMPQTIEAINHAKDAKVPIVVAVNKIDKPEANPDKVMTQLSELGLMPEEWGGDTQYVKISALKKEGIDELLDAVLLQAEILELRANWNCRAEGKVIESRTEHGRGVVSTIIVERGCLKTGDPYVAGIYSGRVRAIFNDRGQKLDQATPSMPVEILGLEAMPNAGDPFQVTDTEKTARAISSKRKELKRFEDAKNVKKVTLDNLYATIDAGEVTELKVVIKADVQGSAEALKLSLEKLSTKDVRLVVIHSSAGAINESDVLLAAADSNAIIIGFNVRPTPKAKILADQEKIDIRKYNVIYKCVEEITQAMEGMLKPDVKEEVIGMLEVRETFKVPKVGTIAGSYVMQGVIKRTSSVNVIRDGIVIYTGKVSSLKRFKDDAKEVATGYECGVGIDEWHDIKVGDQFEVFEFVEVARKLSDSMAETKKATETQEDAGV